jgi:hypothetical protein
VAERTLVFPRVVNVIPTLDANYVGTGVVCGSGAKVRIVHFGCNDATGAALISLWVPPVAFLMIREVAGHLRI